jgi:hypothetical protein
LSSVLRIKGSGKNPARTQSRKPLGASGGTDRRTITNRQIKYILVLRMKIENN